MQGLGSPAGSVERTPQINDRHEELDKNICRLAENISSLSIRLEPALRPSQPSPEPINKDIKPMEIEAPMAKLLRDCNSRVVTMIGNVNDLLNRLEV